jgi:hypothetical protein
MVASPEKVERQLAGLLAPGEHVEFATVCQAKGAAKGAAAQTLIRTTAANVVTNTLMSGAGVMVLRVPPAVWVVLTTSRILMFNRQGINNTARSLGTAVFDAQRTLLAADHRVSPVRNSLTLSDSRDGAALCVLNFGARRSAPRTLAAACGAAGS